MGNKNKYNNYFNNEQNTNIEETEILENNTIIESNNINNEENKIYTDTDFINSCNNDDLVTVIEDEVLDETTNNVIEDEVLDETTNNVIEDEVLDETIVLNAIPKVRVNSKALNIRKEPSKDADIVTIVYEDELLMLSESTIFNGFYKVKTNTGIDGYCMEQFVDLV